MICLSYLQANYIPKGPHVPESAFQWCLNGIERVINVGANYDHVCILALFQRQHFLNNILICDGCNFHTTANFKKTCNKLNCLDRD